MRSPEAPPTSSLRILFLDSWIPAPHEGSGTAVGISTLHRGLVELGHSVEVIRPVPGTRSLLGRLGYNGSLPRRLRREGVRSGASSEGRRSVGQHTQRNAGPGGGAPGTRSSTTPSLIVGFDLDGFLWARRRPATPPYVVALKGIAADEARYSRSSAERALLSTLALLERRNALAADRILVPSAYSAEVAERAYGVHRERIRVVPEPIDLGPWERLRGEAKGNGWAAPPPGRPTILSVARQYPRKDTATLLRAVRRVREKLPALHLRVAGGGPELERLRRLARELRISKTVTFHGEVPEDEELRRMYFEADLFALPSLQEGFGIVFLEAMAAGLPLVAARAGAVPEVVAEGEVGLLVEPGNEIDLADALTALLTDPAKRRRMGEAGVRRAEEFEYRRVAATFLSAALSRTNSLSAGSLSGKPLPGRPMSDRPMSDRPMPPESMPPGFPPP